MVEVSNRVGVSAVGEVVGVEDLVSHVGVFGAYAGPVAPPSEGFSQGVGGGFREGESQGHHHQAGEYQQ